MKRTSTLVDLRDAHAEDIDCGCYGPGRCRYAAALERLRAAEIPWWRRLLSRLRSPGSDAARRTR